MPEELTQRYLRKNYMEKLLLLMFCLMSFFGCRSQQNFDWLIGKWKLEGKPLYEVWEKSDDGERLVGASFKVNGVDTTYLERITFQKFDDAYYYIPDVAENKAPVKFKVTSSTQFSFTAENPEHDFPKIIKYTIVRKANTESLHAVIEGNGKVIPYTFSKVE
jgi:hypothetical protein